MHVCFDVNNKTFYIFCISISDKNHVTKLYTSNSFTRSPFCTQMPWFFFIFIFTLGNVFILKNNSWSIIEKGIYKE